MRAVDEKNVTAFEPVEKFKIDILHLFFDQTLQARESLPEKVAWKRLYADELCFVTSRHRLTSDQRGLRQT